MTARRRGSTSVSDFLRFPHTPHIAWLGAGRPREDKVFATSEVSELLRDDVVIEEKVDGANLGFSVDDDGQLRAQNRGSYVSLDAPTGQWKPLRRWISTRRDSLAEALFPNLMLFGEWCYAVHSVRYTRLPDWFLAFDVYDRATGEFWNTKRRDELLQRLNISSVPRLARGHFTVDDLKRMLGHSRLTDSLVEGLYVRQEDERRLVNRAKLVRAEFVQTIEEHWSKRALEMNQLAST